MATTHHIAVIPGDVIGKEVMVEGLRVLKAAAARYDIAFDFDEFASWCIEHYV